MHEEEVVIDGKVRKKKTANPKMRTIRDMQKQRDDPIDAEEEEKLRKRSIFINL